MVTRNRLILSNQLWDFAERGFVTRFQVLRGFPDVVVVIREKFIPVFFLLLPDRVVVLSCSGLRRFLQVFDGLP